MSETTSLDALIGETLVTANGMSAGSEEVTLTSASGRTFRMHHEQDCCESVSVNEVIGTVEDLIGSPILKAEESTNSEDATGIQYPDSFTWTFYHFATIKGYVTLRWLGESNGYYSEGVDFQEVPA